MGDLYKANYESLGGGIVKASSWADAVANAKSYILVHGKGVSGVSSRIYTFIIPKEYFTETMVYTSGFCFSASNCCMVGFTPATQSFTAHINGQSTDYGSSFTVTYYYDV